METPTVPHGVDEWRDLPRNWTKVGKALLKEDSLWSKFTLIFEYLEFLQPRNLHTPQVQATTVPRGHHCIQI